jgi:diacylglycerol kinase family enzyme
MRVLVAINDRAGGTDAGLQEFVRIVGSEVDEVVLRYMGSRRLAELVADADEFDRVVAAGGDGTISAIAYAIRDTEVPVLVYPAGTANLLASNIGMPIEPPALARILFEGKPVDFDLGELEQAHEDGTTVCTGFAVMAGAGYDASIMRRAEPLKQAMGAAAYLVAAVSNLTPKVSQFELSLDGERISTDGIAVLVGNFGRIQFDLTVTPGTDPRDGLFDIAVVRTKNVVGLLPAVAAAMLDRIGEYPERSPSLDLYSAREIHVAAEPPLRVQTDGDVLDARTPFTARVLPGATTLLVPVVSEFAP